MERPLLDADHAPDVLVESRRLELPPSLAGNRFGRGWRTWRDDGGAHLFPSGEDAVLEIVHLDARARRLALDVETPPAGTVALRLGDEVTTATLAAGTVEVPLPAELPTGRVPIVLSGLGEAVLRGAGFREVRPGTVDFDNDGSVVESGFAAVDVVRRLAEGTVLRGRLEGPKDGFAVVVEDRSAGRLTVPVAGAFEVLLPAGLVRIRLLASGSEAEGRWRDLRLAEPVPEAVAAAAATTAAPPAAPRVVVLYVLDALRADTVGHLGGPSGVSPHLDRLAAEGVSFTRHQSVAPNTLPSTKALFLGHAFRQRGGWKLPAEGAATLAELFAAAGYRTAAFSGNVYVSDAYGTLRGFEHRELEKLVEGSGEFNDNVERVQAAALAWLRAVPASERVFLYVHVLQPHNPYDPPRPYRDALAPPGTIDGSTRTLLAVQHGRREVTPADRERLRGLYAGGLAYADARIGALADELARRYPPGEVLLAVTADHGEELFDHGGVLHGYTLYGEQLRIPLVLWWPGRLAPRRVAEASDNLDLQASLRALIGAPPSEEGRPFWDLLLGESAAPGDVRFASAASLQGGLYAAQSERLKLIWAPQKSTRYGMGEGVGRAHDAEYLFDLENDRGETTNLAGRPSLEAEWLRSRLLAWIARGHDEGDEAKVDRATREQLRALGYLE